MAAVREIEGILQEVGAPQHGVVGRTQLIRRGIAGHVIDRMLRSGRLKPVARGVYQVGPLAQPRAAEMSAVLRCGAGCRISHVSAAVLLGIMAPAYRSVVEVTLSRRARRRIAGVRVHRVRDLLSREATSIDGIPVTTPARTLLDLAAGLRARSVEQALATALRLRLVVHSELQAMVARHPRHRGAAVLGQLLADQGRPAFTRSEAEEKLLLIVREALLPRPELNVALVGHEVDFLWRAARVVAEVDGYAFHGSAQSFAADRRRDAELAAAGYRVLRFTWVDVTEARLATAVRLAQALAR